MYTPGQWRGWARAPGLACCCPIRLRNRRLDHDRGPGPTWGGLFRARALALPPRAASRSPVSSCVLAASPPVFVLEYYLDTLWKGTLLFIVCILLISFGLVSEV